MNPALRDLRRIKQVHTKLASIDAANGPRANSLGTNIPNIPKIPDADEVPIDPTLTDLMSMVLALIITYLPGHRPTRHR